MKSYLFIISLISATILLSCNSKIENYKTTERIPSIFPDYTGIMIPSNIAPLNFRINEPGNEFEVHFYTQNENPVVVKNSNPKIQINIPKWHKLLKQGKGSKLYIDVFVKSNDGKWQKFKPIINEISTEDIDNHLVYRIINTGYELWNNIGIFQRNLENFEEKPILENKSIDYGCINCHSFANNDPNKMMLHVRAFHGGTLVSNNGKLTKVDTKTKYTLNGGAYPSWHPDGKHIVFSVNKIGQFFCSGETRIEVADELSDLIVYDVEKNTITTSPKVSTANRENLPVWSPDGKYIYYINAQPGIEIDNRIQSKYDLMRIGFNVDTNIWGEIDTIISSALIDKTISFPKISPNGKFLIFCTSDNGYFTIHHPKTDLNLLDLQTGEFHKMNINSPETDSYHSFSSGGHWFVFSSKRLDGLFTRPFFSYLDENGKASKPFVLPQKDPDFYNSFIKNYNIPELIIGEVPNKQIEIRDKILESAVPAKIDPRVDTVYMKNHLLMDIVKPTFQLH